MPDKVGSSGVIRVGGIDGFKYAFTHSLAETVMRVEDDPANYASRQNALRYIFNLRIVAREFGLSAKEYGEVIDTFRRGSDSYPAELSEGEEPRAWMETPEAREIIFDDPAHFRHADAWLTGAPELITSNRLAEVGGLAPGESPVQLVWGPPHRPRPAQAA